LARAGPASTAEEVKPVTENVRVEMERHREKPWKIRDRTLKR
jgi:hypothetical protein